MDSILYLSNVFSLSTSATMFILGFCFGIFTNKYTAKTLYNAITKRNKNERVKEKNELENFYKKELDTQVKNHALALQSIQKECEAMLENERKECAKRLESKQREINSLQWKLRYKVT